MTEKCSKADVFDLMARRAFRALNFDEAHRYFEKARLERQKEAEKETTSE
jgi:hypothetical protein